MTAGMYALNRTCDLRRAVLSVLLVAPLGCVEASELDELELEGEADDPQDEAEFRWSTPLTNHPTLVTSMNADTYGGNNGGCWDTAPSGNVRHFQQYRCHAQDNQLWLFEALGGGDFMIRSADDDDLCLDVPGFNYASGQDLQLFPCNGGNNQKWTIFNHDGDSATIRPKDATGLCVDVENGVKTEQATIQIFSCHGGSNQAWRFHDWKGSDSHSCDWSMRFGPQVVSPGSRRSFAAPWGSYFNTLCAENLQSDSVDCPSGTNWFVIDSPWGSNDFNVRCFSE